MRRPSWLMSSTTPSATRKSASLARLQVEKGRPCSAGLDLAVFLISRRSGRVNVLGCPPAPVLRVERVESVCVEVVDHVANTVRTGEGYFGDLRNGHALGGQQHCLGPSPRHHRSGT